MSQKPTPWTRPDETRLELGTLQLRAVGGPCFSGREIANSRTGPGLWRWGATALRAGCRCAGLSSFAFLAGASAQNALAPAPWDSAGANPGPQFRQSRQMDSSLLAPPPAAVAPEEPRLQWGSVNFRPHFLYRFLYGDGLPARSGDKITTAINEVYPGILFEVGPHWRLDYTPSLHYYSNSRFRDTTDQSVALDGATTYQNWDLGLSQHYTTTSQPLIETAAQTDQEIYATAINATCHFNTQASLELGLNQNFRFLGQNSAANLVGNNLIDSKEWSTLDWFNYQFRPTFGAAVGVGAGYVDLSAGSATSGKQPQAPISAMSYEQFQARIRWQAADKLSLELSGGIEDRQFLDVNAPDSVSPLLSASIVYRPFEGTSVSLEAARSVMTSYSADYGQVFENTDLNGHFQQRLLKKLQLDLTGGYRTVSYQANFVGGSGSREDHYTYFNARLSVPFLKRGTAGVFYQAGDNTSSVSEFQLSSRQVGFDAGYRF